MICLRDDCLVIKLGKDGSVVVDAETVAGELFGVTEDGDPVLPAACYAVVTYFRQEEQRQRITVDQFCTLISDLLRCFDYEIIDFSEDEELGLG